MSDSHEGAFIPPRTPDDGGDPYSAPNIGESAPLNFDDWDDGWQTVQVPPVAPTPTPSPAPRPFLPPLATPTPGPAPANTAPIPVMPPAPATARRIGLRALTLDRTEIPRLREELGMVKEGIGRVAVGSLARLAENRQKKHEDRVETVEKLQERYGESFQKIVDVDYLRNQGLSKQQAKQVVKMNARSRTAQAIAPGGRHTGKRGATYVDRRNPFAYLNPANLVRLTSQRRSTNASEAGIEAAIARYTADGMNPLDAERRARSDHSLRVAHIQGGWTVNHKRGYEAVHDPHLEREPGDFAKLSEQGKHTRVVRQALEHLEQQRPETPILKINSRTGRYEPVVEHGVVQMRPMTDSEIYVAKMASESEEKAEKAEEKATRRRERIDENRRSTERRIQRIERMPQVTQPLRRFKKRVHGATINPRS